MDDKAQKAFHSIVLCLLFLTGVLAQAVDFEHISLERKAQLEKEFLAARSAGANPEAVAGRKWTCDMYGVRSRLQVQRGINLYSLKKTELGYSNSGSQVIRQYGAAGEDLVGGNARFEDRIRLTTDGRLISRLSVRGENQPENVIAYSLCR